MQKQALMLRLFPLPCYTNDCMKKAAGRKDEPNDVIAEEIQLASQVFDAKQKFIAATLNLSWRLALTVLIPLLAGIWLDKKFDSAPSYTITGFMLAIVFGCMAVWQTVKEVNQLQAEEENKGKKKNA